MELNLNQRWEKGEHLCGGRPDVSYRLFESEYRELVRDPGAFPLQAFWKILSTLWQMSHSPIWNCMPHKSVVLIHVSIITLQSVKLQLKIHRSKVEICLGSNTEFYYGINLCLWKKFRVQFPVILWFASELRKDDIFCMIMNVYSELLLK